MTVACAQLSAAGSLATAGGLSATNIPIGEELLEATPGGRLRLGHRLNRGGRRPRLNTSRSYKQLLSYVSNGLQGNLPKNTSDVPKCTCVMDGHQGDLNVAVIKITLVILGLWAISAGTPLSRPIAVIVLYRPDYLIYLYGAGTLRGCMWASRALLIDHADILDGALTAFKIQKAVNAKNRAGN